MSNIVLSEISERTQGVPHIFLGLLGHFGTAQMNKAKLKFHPSYSSFTSNIVLTDDIQRNCSTLSFNYTRSDKRLSIGPLEQFGTAPRKAKLKFHTVGIIPSCPPLSYLMIFNAIVIRYHLIMQVVTNVFL